MEHYQAVQDLITELQRVLRDLDAEDAYKQAALIAHAFAMEVFLELDI